MLWDLWTQQQETHKTPSEQLELRAWFDEMTDGLSGWLLCDQVDRAVTFFGRHVESKLHETNESGQFVYTLEELIDNRTRGLSDLMRDFPSMVRKD